jgi:hypothetical protein
MRKLPVVPFCRMTSGLQKQPNQTHHPRRPASARGAFRPIVTKREAGCDGRGTSTDEGRCARTAKACGPGAPWLALSLRTGDVGPLGPDAPRSQATVTMRSRTPGRARTTLLTPLRREGRGAPVEPVVNNSCAFYTAHEAAGATSIRSSLRPLSSEGLGFLQNSDASRRGKHSHAIPSRRCFAAPRDEVGTLARKQTLVVGRRQRVRAKRGPMTGSAPSRT